MKIRNKLITYFIIVLVVPMTVLSFVLLRNSQINLENEITSNLETTASNRKNQIEQFFQNNIDIVKIIAGRSVLKAEFVKYIDNPSKEQQNVVSSFLDDPLVSLPSIKELSLIDLSGIIVASSDRKVIGKDLSKEKYFIEGGRNAQSYFSDEKGTLSLFCVTPVLVNGKVVGFIRSLVGMNVLEEIVKDKTGLGETGEVIFAIQGTDGNPRFVFKGSSEAQVFSHSDLITSLHEAIKGKENILNPGIDYRGVKVIAVTKHIENVQGGLVTEIDQSEANAPLLNVLIADLTVSLFGLLLAVLIALFLANNFSGPIKELSDITKKISKDNLVVSFPQEMLESQDEIGTLSVNFKTMMDNLSHVYKDMEEKVAHRTEDIEGRNKKLEESETSLKIALEETERINKLMVGRELKMSEMKKQIEELEAKSKTS
ncbi:MAG: cache domain-containing protein [Candidatus Parcubacteria bacterium]|nr:cache domain-containing protein [Candidatus Parcubacteria bacterium]